MVQRSLDSMKISTTRKVYALTVISSQSDVAFVQPCWGALYDPSGPTHVLLVIGLTIYDAKVVSLLYWRENMVVKRVGRTR